MEETRCYDCENDYDQCGACEREDERKKLFAKCHHAEEIGKSVLRSDCAYRTINVKKMHAAHVD